MQEQEIASIVMQAQTQGIDMYEILSKREMQFLNGSFEPNLNYARLLQFTIKRKLKKALGNPNGHESSRYNFVTREMPCLYNVTHDPIPRGRGLAWYASSLGRSRSPVQIRPTPLNYE